jgi:hypothetical protein
LVVEAKVPNQWCEAFYLDVRAEAILLILLKGLRLQAQLNVVIIDLNAK